MSIRDEVKETLGVIEPLRRKLSAADETWAEIDSVGGILSARKAELVETEAWLERTKVAAQETSAALDQLSATSAQEEKRIAARIDRLKAEMLELERQVAEKQSAYDSLLAGMAALQRRLVGNPA